MAPMPLHHPARRRGPFSLRSAAALGLGLLAAWTLQAASAPAWAQQQGFGGQAKVPENLVRFDTRVEPRVARPGEHARLIVTARIHEGWYIYSLEPQGEFAPPPSKLTVRADGLKALGIPYEVNPKAKKDQVFQMTLAFHTQAARFYQNLRVPEGHGPGRVPVQATLRYQACNNKICTPPRNESLQAGLGVEQGPVRPQFSYMERTVDYLNEDGSFRINAGSLESVVSQGLVGFLLLAVGFGLLSLLTPCVFPMIPITVSFFTATARERGGRTGGLALLFGAGIVTTYTGLGLALSLLLGATGISQFATSPWVNLVVAGFFVLFALSLMGAFDLALPGRWVNALDSRARRIKGPVGVTVMGLAFTATSFTCTVQFVGTLLIAAVAGQVFWPVVGMVVFSTVFAAPFVLLALFPRSVMALRGRGGPWMTQVKVVLGILELLFAFKFVSNADLAWQWGLFDRDLLLGAAAVLAALSALVVMGLVPWPGIRVQRLRWPRLAWGAVFLAVAGYFALGLQGEELDSYTEAYLPPPVQQARVARAALQGKATVPEKVEELPWHPTLGPALEEARRVGKPVFIDFTGYTCINCRWMEKEVFAREPVLRAFQEHFVLAKLYTDGGDYAEQNQTLQVERFRTLALPYYVILSPQNAVLAKYAGIMPDAGDFLAWLEQGRRQMVALEAQRGE